MRREKKKKIKNNIFVANSHQKKNLLKKPKYKFYFTVIITISIKCKK